MHMFVLQWPRTPRYECNRQDKASRKNKIYFEDFDRSEHGIHLPRSHIATELSPGSLLLSDSLYNSSSQNNNEENQSNLLEEMSQVGHSYGGRLSDNELGILHQPPLLCPTKWSYRILRCALGAQGLRWRNYVAAWSQMLTLGQL
jgi:hypothetical protein